MQLTPGCHARLVHWAEAQTTWRLVVPIEKTCCNADLSDDFVASLRNRVQHNGQNILLATPMADIIGDMVDYH